MQIKMKLSVLAFENIIFYLITNNTFFIYCSHLDFSKINMIFYLALVSNGQFTSS